MMAVLFLYDWELWRAVIVQSGILLELILCSLLPHRMIPASWRNSEYLSGRKF